MWLRVKLYFQNLDWWLLAAIFLLVLFSLIELYSIALGQGGGAFISFQKQLWFVIGGLAIFSLLIFLDYHFWRSFNRYLYIAGLIILVAVLLFGQNINGTKGWFNIFGLGIQPVEFVKIILIIFLARIFSNSAFKTRPLKYFLLSGAATFGLILLVLAQPDFGSALLLAAVWIFMLLVSGFKRRYFIAIFLGGVIVFAGSWLFLFKDYQKERVLTFINPSYNSLEEGYNIHQATIAIGSGGLTGRGVGFGSQSQLKFLPEAHTDFIFSVVAEELGFLGILLVFFFYGVFFFRSLAALHKINDDFAILFLLGATALIFIEMFINIGMNIGILPVVGIALPFISYGGSSILANFIILGIIQNIIIKSKT